MQKTLNKFAKFLFNLFASIKISNLSELVVELVKALEDGKITEEEKDLLIEKAQNLLTDLDEKTQD